MTFPLGSLGAGAGAQASAAEGTYLRQEGTGGSLDAAVGGAGWRDQTMVLLGAALWLIALLAMATHHPADAAFSTSGTGEPLHNRAGVIGAWFSGLA